MARPIRPWFRFYVEAFSDRKMRRLRPAQRWIWVAILGAARESPEAGKLYVAPGLPMSRRELADYAGVNERDIGPALSAMEAMSMVSIDTEGLVSVTNWDHRQFESDDVTQRTRSHRERSGEQRRNVPGNAPETETETEEEKPTGDTSPRADVERLCSLLADRVESNGTPRPKVTKAWRDAARLMIDKDGRTPDQIAWLIDWSQRDQFWRSNVLSMPTLRQQFDKMRLRAVPTSAETIRTGPDGEPILPAPKTKDWWG